MIGFIGWNRKPSAEFRLLSGQPQCEEGRKEPCHPWKSIERPLSEAPHEHRIELPYGE